MFIENVDTTQCIPSLDSYAGYWNWDIATNTEPLSSLFKRTVAREIEFSGKSRILIAQIFEEDLVAAVDLFQKHNSTKGKIPYKIKLRYCEDSSVLYFLCKGRIIEWDEDGNPLRMTGCSMDITEFAENKIELNKQNEPDARGLALDITNQKNKEIELKKYREELEKSQFLLNETGRMAKVGGWDYDLATGTITWTKEVYEIHEVPIDFIPDMHLLSTLYSDDARDILYKSINDAVAYKRESDHELLSITFTGRKKWVRVIGKPVINANGTVVGLRGIVQDINEKKLLDMELRQSASLINNRNQALYNFAHIASHNLRTHAGNIGSILSLVEMSEEQGEKEELIKSLYRISSALNSTIDHLNDVAQIQTGIGAAKVSIQFSEMYDKIVDILQPTINETGTSLQADFSEATEVKYIPAYLESIMLNLLSNAIKYRHPERKPFITVKSFTKDNKKFLEVTDNGLGINLAKHKNKLFGMYKTFHAHPDARGIGLFITKNQVDALGGNITVESEPGKGTIFLVQF